MEIFRSSRKQQQEYRNSPAISQSNLKLLLHSVNLFNAMKSNEEDEYGEKDHFIIGIGVDTLLTMGIDTYLEEYHVSEVEKPSDIHLRIIKQLYEYHRNYVDEEILVFQSQTSHDWLAENEDFIGWQGNWKWETKVDKFFIPVNQAYWDDLVLAQNKQILSKSQDELIKEIVGNLINSEFTGQYFLPPNPFRNIEIHYQLPIYFIYKGVNCKALLDQVIIDHENKTVQPLDIKTLGDYTLNFFNSVIQRRYDFQAAFYTQALYSFITGTYDDYKILPFKFIVESTIAPGNPLVYTCSDELLLVRGKEGIPTIKLSKGHVLKGVPGFNQAIEKYKWYLENGMETDKTIVESNGDLLIGLEGIIHNENRNQ